MEFKMWMHGLSSYMGSAGGWLHSGCWKWKINFYAQTRICICTSVDIAWFIYLFLVEFLMQAYLTMHEIHENNNLRTIKYVRHLNIIIMIKSVGNHTMLCVCTYLTSRFWDLDLQ